MDLTFKQAQKHAQTDSDDFHCLDRGRSPHLNDSFPLTKPKSPASTSTCTHRNFSDSISQTDYAKSFTYSMSNAKRLPAGVPSSPGHGSTDGRSLSSVRERIAEYERVINSTRSVSMPDAGKKSEQRNHQQYSQNNSHLEFRVNVGFFEVLKNSPSIVAVQQFENNSNIRFSQETSKDRPTSRSNKREPGNCSSSINASPNICADFRERRKNPQVLLYASQSEEAQSKKKIKEKTKIKRIAAFGNNIISMHKDRKRFSYENERGISNYNESKLASPVHLVADLTGTRCNINKGDFNISHPNDVAVMAPPVGNQNPQLSAESAEYETTETKDHIPSTPRKNFLNSWLPPTVSPFWPLLRFWRSRSNSSKSPSKQHNTTLKSGNESTIKYNVLASLQEEQSADLGAYVEPGTDIVERHEDSANLDNHMNAHYSFRSELSESDSLQFMCNSDCHKTELYADNKNVALAENIDVSSEREPSKNSLNDAKSPKHAQHTRITEFTEQKVHAGPASSRDFAYLEDNSLSLIKSSESLEPVISDLDLTNASADDRASKLSEARGMSVTISDEIGSSNAARCEGQGPSIRLAATEDRKTKRRKIFKQFLGAISAAKRGSIVQKKKSDMADTGESRKSQYERILPAPIDAKKARRKADENVEDNNEMLVSTAETTESSYFFRREGSVSSVTSPESPLRDLQKQISRTSDCSASQDELPELLAGSDFANSYLLRNRRSSNDRDLKRIDATANLRTVPGGSIVICDAHHHYMPKDAVIFPGAYSDFEEDVENQSEVSMSSDEKAYAGCSGIRESDEGLEDEYTGDNGGKKMTLSTSITLACASDDTH